MYSYQEINWYEFIRITFAYEFSHTNFLIRVFSYEFIDTIFVYKITSNQQVDADLTLSFVAYFSISIIVYFLFLSSDFCMRFSEQTFSMK